MLTLAILYATGCRPDELQTGVTVNYDSKKNEIEFKIIGSKLNRRMRRGIGIRKIKVKINNENARFLKVLLINLLKTQCHMIIKSKLKVQKRFPVT